MGIIVCRREGRAGRGSAAALGDPLTAALAAGAALIFSALYLMTIPERTSMVEEPLPGTPRAAEL